MGKERTVMPTRSDASLASQHDEALQLVTGGIATVHMDMRLRGHTPVPPF